MVWIDNNGYVRRELEEGVPQSEVEPSTCARFKNACSSCYGKISIFFPTTSWIDKNAKVSNSLIIAQIVMYFVSSMAVPPRGWYKPTGLAALRIGSEDPDFIACVACGYVLELRRFLVPIFLHLNLIHFLFNLIFQLTSSPSVEAQMASTGKFLALFLGSGAVGNLFSASFGELSMGASSSCFGLLGASYMTEYIAWPAQDAATRLAVRDRLLRQTAFLVLWELINWDTIAHAAHFGGLVGGSLLWGMLQTSSVSSNAVRTDRIRLTSQLSLITVVIGGLLWLWLPVFLDFAPHRSEFRMFFIHRVLNTVTMMYNEADELTACHFIRPSTYLKSRRQEKDEEEVVKEADEVEDEVEGEVIEDESDKGESSWTNQVS